MLAMLLVPVGVANHPQSDAGMVVVFDHKTGNEWWVEVVLTGQDAGSVTSVEARDTGGAWVVLTKRSWGAYAASFRIEPGNEVQFRSSWSGGAQQLSCLFSHPAGVERCATTGVFDADFKNVKGNEWWVEVTVSANLAVTGVDARVDGGAWKPLTKRSWGAWATSFSTPSGSGVQFRALSGSSQDLSGCYRWTAATPIDCASTNQWPREGSFVKYEARSGTSVPGGSYWDETTSTVTFTRKGTHWEVLCEGRYRQHSDGSPDIDRTFRVKASFDPPTAPRTAAKGTDVELYGVDACTRSHVATLTVGNDTTVATKKNGLAVNSPARSGSYEPECMCQGASGTWNKQTGLVLTFGFGGRISSESGKLIDTDAPIGPNDAVPSPPPAPVWPREGSFVKYTSRSDYDDPDWGYVAYYNTTWTYSGGVWRAACTEDFYGKSTPESHNSFTHNDTVFPEGPRVPVTGDLVAVPAGTCGSWGSDWTRVKGKFSESTFRNGAGVTTQVWWADEDPDGAGDDDIWWDTDTGVVVRWEFDAVDGSRITGRLTDTDAPLG